MFTSVLFFCLCFGLSLTQDSPAAIVVHPPSYSTATTSQTVRMTCAAYGVPKPTITWSRASGDLTSKLLQSNSGFKQYDKTVTVNGTDFLVSVLEICGVSTVDTDEYTCSSNNGVSGAAITTPAASFFLSVSGATPEPPAVIVRPPSGVTMVDAGSTVEAVCVAYGNPVPSIMWKKDGCTDLSCSKDSKMYDEMVKYGDITFRKSIVQICNVTEGHTGSYTCQAMNGVAGVGVAPSDSSWQLSVKIKPSSTSVSIPAPPTTTCPSYAPVAPSTSDARGTATPSVDPTTGRITDDGALSSGTYTIIIVILAIIIVLLLTAVIVVIIIAVKRGSPSQKADIAMPSKANPEVLYSVENPIHNDEEALVQDDEKDADTMTYADLAKKMADEADD